MKNKKQNNTHALIQISSRNKPIKNLEFKENNINWEI